MYETPLDLLEAGANQTIAERFRAGIQDQVYREFECAADVEVNDLVYLDEQGVIRPVRENEASGFLGKCVAREKSTATVASQHGITMTLAYEGREPDVGEVVFAAGLLVKGTVSAEPPVGGPVYQVGVVTGDPEKGYVPVRFIPQSVPS